MGCFDAPIGRWGRFFRAFCGTSGGANHENRSLHHLRHGPGTAGAAGAAPSPGLPVSRGRVPACGKPASAGRTAVPAALGPGHEKQAGGLYQRGRGGVSLPPAGHEAGALLPAGPGGGVAWGRGDPLIRHLLRKCRLTAVAANRAASPKEDLRAKSRPADGCAPKRACGRSGRRI